MASNTAIKFLTYNCNGLNDKIKTKRVLSALIKTQAEVLFLQETHIRNNASGVFKCNRLSHQIQAPGSSKAGGEGHFAFCQAPPGYYFAGT